MRVAQDELGSLEEAGWRALSTSGEAAVEFYDRVLDHAAVMMFPGGLVIEGRAAILESMSGQPWSSYRLEDLKSLRPTPETGVVFYGVVAERGDAPTYSALVSSAYVRRDDGWRLVFHQHTLR
ncbi:MAG TPA: nuclear transport factor 2 family protein [Nocardioidaceae bacterium]|nr:nuclear transport factor 2 family protein [Nocardioidaceae bacterium]